MRTEQNVLHRKLTVEYVGDNNSSTVSPGVLNPISKIYNQKPFDNDAEKVIFIGKFEGKTPNDIGGNGSILYYDSHFGSVTAYVENFRGSDDIFKQVNSSLKATDIVVDILSGWSKQQFDKLAGFEKLDKFVNTQLRSDAKSLALFVWMFTNSDVQLKPGPEKTQTTKPTTAPASDLASDNEDFEQKSIMARGVQFILARGYVDKKNLYKLTSIEWQPNEGNKNPDLENAIRFALSNKVGLQKNGELTNAIIKFVFDTNDKVKQESLSDYLKTTDGFKKFRREYELKIAAKAATQPAAQPTSQPTEEEKEFEILAEYFGSQVKGIQDLVVSIISFDTPDELEISLAVPTKPLETNGKFDAIAGVVQWHGSIHNSPKRLPAICYAVWSEPNTEAQKKLAGKIFLQGQDLHNYIDWYNSLPASKVAQWDKFLKTLTKKNIETLLEFKFEEEQKPAFRKHHMLESFYEDISGKKVPKEQP